jgi:phage head maturation protease
MKRITSTYRLISVEGEFLEGIWFPKYDVFKEVSVLGFSLFGEMINRESFNDKKDAENFLKMLCDKN